MDSRQFTPPAETLDLGRHLKLLAVQRLSPVKRVDMLIELTRVLRDSGANVKLLVVGKGPEHAALAEQARNLPDGSVELLGYVPDEQLPDLFKSAHLFLSHSMFETFGVTFAQAMATGLPVVAARTSSIPLVIEDEVNGILFPPGDLEAAATAVLSLLRDEERYKEISRQNVRKARELYDWDHIATAYERTLAAAVAARSCQRMT
ncbi:glycosyltransferase family 4 protein [Geodermatophilus sp. URMC 63]